MARRRSKLLGHNAGPPLDDYEGPPWGKGDAHRLFQWKRAHDAAWKNIPPEIALRRFDRAEALGLTYEEYTLEILERGRYLQAEDVARIEEIKRARRRRRSQAFREYLG